MNSKNLILLLLLGILSTPVLASEKIAVTDAWIREAPPMAKSLAAYMKIKNNSNKTVMLRSITSKSFERSIIHRTEIHEGMARMTPESRVIIKPHSEVSFEPGKLHLMFNQPVKTFKAGDEALITLHFTNGSKLDVTVSVKKMGGKNQHKDQHDDKHHH